MPGKFGGRMARCCTVFAALALAGCTADTPNGESPPAQLPLAADEPEPAPAQSPFTVSQQIDPAYVPGAANRVVVTMDYTGGDPVTALALQTEVPAGWQYAGITGYLHPAIEPPAGTRDVLTMVWIKIPAFPATLEYELDVPETAAGACRLSAHVVYRTLGGELHSPENEVTSTSAK